MSHFSVLVIGKDPEAQLAPYSEELEVERYKDYEDPDPTGWPVSAAVKEGIDPTDLATVAAHLSTAWDESYEVDEKGLYHWSTYNPQSKWDWYSLGGRWTGHLVLKTGAAGEVGSPGLGTSPAMLGHADQAKKGDVDFDAMRLNAASTAADQFDRYAAIAAEHPAAVDFQDIAEEDIDRKRQIYWDQPLIQALRKANLLSWESGPNEMYGMGRESFILNASRKAPTTYAMVAEGVWKGKGRMGWWGMSSDEVDPKGWVDFWWKMVDGLPDDTLLSVYDCHI